MAIKKPELYSSLWSNCDELRGGVVVTASLLSKGDREKPVL
jgi:hypothetical protein